MRAEEAKRAMLVALEKKHWKLVKPIYDRIWESASQGDESVIFQFEKELADGKISKIANILEGRGYFTIIRGPKSIGIFWNRRR